MQNLVTLITTAAFWLHIALGCCAHHAHATEGPACSHAAIPACEHCGHQHDGQREADTSSPANSESPDPTCNHVQCVFMASGKTEVAKPSFICFQPHVAAELNSSTVIASLDAAALDPGGHDAQPPVRPHLLHQVLLN
jgi:hypothetical protein